MLHDFSKYTENDLDYFNNKAVENEENQVFFTFSVLSVRLTSKNCVCKIFYLKTVYLV